MIRYCITDRNLTGVAQALLAGSADYVQVRDKELSGAELLGLVGRLLALPNPAHARILINSRIDVAVCAGAAGVHLPGDSFSPGLVRRVMPQAVISAACHSIEEVIRAEAEGADMALFSPVFAPLSKVSAGPAQGLEKLAKAARAVRIPVIALGGITEVNAPDCVAAGAAGVAGITLFTRR